MVFNKLLETFRGVPSSYRNHGNKDLTLLKCKNELLQRVGLFIFL